MVVFFGCVDYWGEIDFLLFKILGFYIEIIEFKVVEYEVLRLY